MPQCTLVPTPLEVALHDYVNIEDPRRLYTKLERKFASCFLSARWQRQQQQQQQQPDWLCCADCDDRRTHSIGRWQLKWLEKQLVGLGWDSNFTCLWNGSVHDVSFLCTKSLIIFPLQQDYPTHCQSVIQCLY